MILKQFGGSDDFEVAEIENPEVNAGHILVTVAASSVNTMDTMIRSMDEDLKPISPDLPVVLGMDFAGTAEAVGEDAKLVAHKPKMISMREVAAPPLVGITAYGR